MIKGSRKYKSIDKYLRVNTIVDPITNCWIWQLSKGKYGHGIATWDTKFINSHKLSWINKNGPIPEGKQINHCCPTRNSSCCNPDHLYAGTVMQNAWDSMNDGTAGKNIPPTFYGKNHPNSRAVIIHNVTYDTVSDAAKAIGCQGDTIRRRIKNKIPGYKFK